MRSSVTHSCGVDRCGERMLVIKECKPSAVRSNLSDHEGLDLASVWDMRADAEVDHGATAVDRGGSPVGDFGLDEVFLVLVILHEDTISPSTSL